LVEAEIVLAVRDEMALSLEDILRRRVPLALIERMDHSLIKRLADFVAPHMRRDSAELAVEFHQNREQNRPRAVM
jgi:glycerol-3-phosphate dehydrogenase